MSQPEAKVAAKDAKETKEEKAAKAALEAQRVKEAWRSFNTGEWQRDINVRDFIVANVTPYAGGPEFLAKPTAKTLAVWEKLQPSLREEIKKGVLDTDESTPSSLTSHGPGYIGGIL